VKWSESRSDQSLASTQLADATVCPILYDVTVQRKKRRGPRKDAASRKDRLIQARVPRGLASTLQHEARRRRLSVSHLIRNVLEDTFQLVDHVVAEVDNLVSDSVELASQVRRDAAQIARTARRGIGRERQGSDLERGEPSERRTAPAPAKKRGGSREVVSSSNLGHIYAWNEVVLNRAARCARCGLRLEPGSEARLGLTQDPSASPTWLCRDCVRTLVL
jgi:hypothetical protein